MTRTTAPSSTRPSTDDPTPTTRTRTEHDTSKQDEPPEAHLRATRSKDPHLCIPIRGCGPVFGLPRVGATPVDHKVNAPSIVFGGSRC